MTTTGYNLHRERQVSACCVEPGTQLNTYATPALLLPYSLRVVLENLLRPEDGQRVTAVQVEALRAWGATPDHDTSFDR